MSVEVGLTLAADAVTLTRALCDIESVSGNERAIADSVERPRCAACRTWRCSATATRCSPAPGWAATSGSSSAGHLDTVPVAGNLPTWVVGAGTTRSCTAGAWWTP
jgi:succinyl-diaminopimelate desuccinylase